MNGLGRVCASLALCAACGGGEAAPTRVPVSDTPDNRAAAARRYLDVVPPADMFHDMAESMAEVLPTRQAAELQQVLTKYIDLQAFEAFLMESMARHFTADELSALADFYGSPVGRSAMDKFDGYMAETLPFVQEQTQLALHRAEQAQAR